MYYSELIERMKRQARLRECFHRSSECTDTIVRSHSIQNNRILKKISTDGVVTSIELVRGKSDYKQIGRKKASTFSGFCSFHDNEVFKEIEIKDYDRSNDFQSALFAYRALALEYNKKATICRLYKKILEYIEKKEWKAIIEGCDDIPKNQYSPSEQYDYYLGYTVGSQIEIESFERNRSTFRRLFESNDSSFLRTFTVKFRNEFPIAVTSSITIERDMRNKLINTIEVRKEVGDSIPMYLTIFPQNGKTICIFSYYTQDEKYYSNLRDDIINSGEENQKIIITNIIANHIENFFVSSNYWNKLKSEIKERFLKQFVETMVDAGNDLSDMRDINIFRIL